MSDLRPSPSTGFKLDIDHHPDCWYASESEGLVFVVNDGVVHRDKIGRRNGRSTQWQVFRCNDPKCSACALVRWDVLADLIDRGLRGDA